MYEPEKILVQNAGIDPGVAALLQNANKGNMDPAALMAMMNNGGFGGNGGWWWIWIILIFFCWGGFGGNGFGRGSDDASRLASQLNTDTNTSLLMQAIQGNKDAISSLSNTLNCDINAVQTALNTINTSVSQIACDTKLASCEVINAITSGNANLASQLANCCCQTQRSIDSVNLNLTQMNADNRLSICQQTNTLQNAITSGFNNLLTDNANKFNVIGAKIDAQTQMINDKFCQLEMREMQNKIDTLRDEKQGYQLSALTQQQTQNLVNQLRPCPVPAYLTCNPFGCNGGFTGYGSGQSRRKLVDVFISCNGESKKLSVPAERSIINDTSIGLTVATNKEEIANMVRQNYNEFKAKKEAASKYDEEMEKCKDILDQLEAQVEAPIITNTIDNSKEINDLKNDVADIRKMIEDTKKMFMGGFPKPPMPPMPNVPAPMK